MRRAGDSVDNSFRIENGIRRRLGTTPILRETERLNLGSPPSTAVKQFDFLVNLMVVAGRNMQDKISIEHGRSHGPKSAFLKADEAELTRLQRAYEEAVRSLGLLEQLLQRYHMQGTAADYETAFRIQLASRKRLKETQAALELYWLTH